jgi:high affinity Mn2+ porin
MQISREIRALTCVLPLLLAAGMPLSAQTSAGTPDPEHPAHATPLPDEPVRASSIADHGFAGNTHAERSSFALRGYLSTTASSDGPFESRISASGDPLTELEAPYLAIPRLYRASSGAGASTLAAAGDQDAAPAPVAYEQPTFMKFLAKRGEHNIEHEWWNAYGQFTYIYGWKQAFPALYTNANGSINSLLSTPEQSFTGTATLYLGLRLWKGGEAYLVPELISERPLSNLKGIGGAIQDFELQKGGAEIPTLYRSRSYIRQTFEFGGQPVAKESGPTQLGTVYSSRRLVLIAGNLSILDFFDKNAFDIDPRQGLFNLAFLTYAAYDFASDARGYSWGGISELYWDNWSVRAGRITPPKDPNQLPIDFRLFKFYGDQIELEHQHKIGGQDGTLRVLAFRNHENIGRFSDAVAAFEADPQKNAAACTGFNYGSNNATAPDLCWVRKPNVKAGIGVFGQQYIAHDIGVFSRAMYSDGKTEVDAYTSTDRSATFGTLAKGSLWSRPRDVTGVGVNIGWISAPHIEYLRLGGVDGFIGDGHITPAPEAALDVFYSANFRKTYWIAADYQRIANPAFNSDRGPVNIVSFKVHGEF